MGLLTFERRKTITPEVIPQLPDDEREAREALSFKQGLIAFDIVFDKHGTPFILEIQGTDSGARGIANGLASDSRVPEEVKKFARRITSRSSGYQNPRWFEDVADTKDEQLPFIPDAHRPRSIVNKNFDSLFAYGKVILKPLNASKGEGICIFDAEHRAEAAQYAASLRKNYAGFVAQAFIASRGADLAPKELRTHAASLRLFIPFRVVNGKVEITMHGVGYQRVATEPMPETQNGGKGYDKAGVVNLSKDAHAVPMSEAEYQRALPVALKVIQNFISEPERSTNYQELLKQQLYLKIHDINREVDSVTPESVYVRTTAIYSQESLKKVRSGIRFLRFVERELKALPAETNALLQKRGVRITITYLDENHGSIDVTRFRPFSGRADVCIPFSTTGNPYVLARLIQDAANGKRLLK